MFWLYYEKFNYNNFCELLKIISFQKIYTLTKTHYIFIKNNFIIQISKYILFLYKLYRYKIGILLLLFLFCIILLL